MNLIIFSGLPDKKLISKISPIVSLEKIEKIFLIRNSSLRYQKVKSMSPPLFLNVLFVREFLKFLYGFYVCLFKEIDYIIGIFFSPHGIFASLLGKIFKKPVIQIFVGKDVNFIKKHKRIFKTLVKNAKYIGVRGNNSKRRLKEIINRENHFFIQHNVYSFSDLVTEKKQSSKNIDVIYVAHFDDYKRIDVFLEVISRIKERYPGIKAAMLGKDIRKRRAFYEKKKKELGMEEDVTFFGYVKDVTPFLLQSKIFMMTSQAEGLPMAMIEAMNAGLPCVVPDVGDISDIAKDGFNALVVKPLDVDGYASKTVQLLKDRNLYKQMSENALNTLKKKEKEFSLQYNKEIWNNILD